MNNLVHNALLDGLNSFKTDTLTTFNEVLPIALAVLITITVVIFGIKWFMHIIGAKSEFPELSDKEMWREDPNWMPGVKSFDEHGNEIEEEEDY